jgi:hypothetical protein
MLVFPEETGVKTESLSEGKSDEKSDIPDTPLPFYIAGGISIITALFIYLFLPETLIEGKRNKNITVNAFNPFFHFKDIFSLKEARKVFILGACFFFFLCHIMADSLRLTVLAMKAAWLGMGIFHLERVGNQSPN